MAPVFSKTILRNSAFVGSSLIFMYYLSTKRLKKHLTRVSSLDEVSIEYKQRKESLTKEKIKVDINLYKQLRSILKIIIPGYFSPEVGYIILIALSLIGRTISDIFMITNGTIIERAIISKDLKLFYEGFGKFIFAMPMLSLVNNVLKYGLNQLTLRFRKNLAQYLYNQYMSGMTYFQMNNLDTRISNPEHLLSQDVEKFCSGLTELYSNISKPLLDILIYSQALTSTIGYQGPSVLILYLILAGLLLTKVRGPIGKMIATQQKLEGELNYVGSRLIMNSEEIAFYQGNAKEKMTINNAFTRLMDHLHLCSSFQFCVGYIDNIVGRYWATVVGYLSISRPFFSTAFNYQSQEEKIETYYKSGRMMVKLAEAIGRLILAGRELNKLGGYTSRISQLLIVLKDLQHGQFVRLPKDPSLSDSRGKVVVANDMIKFHKVPLTTPNGDVLIKELNFEVPPGVNVLVCGPNGCGKSSLFRILGELWPIKGGVLVKPTKAKLFYIPQRPYMTLGTLRDQIIYPDTKEKMNDKGCKDIDLEEILKNVQLEYILAREGGWDSIQDWMVKLSGGEKQRIAMARLFYSKPQYAILDECTSAVSVDVEGKMYEYCKKEGITLFTVSHRKSLWKYHDYSLFMDGEGNYEFKKIESHTKEFGS